jgi:hypothetical protein
MLEVPRRARTRVSLPPIIVPARTFVYETWNGTLGNADAPVPATTRAWVDANLPASAYNLVDLGDSTSITGYPAQEVNRFEIGDSASECHIYIGAGVHASEWASVVATMEFAKRLDNPALSDNPDLYAEMAARTHFVVHPVINSGGFAHATKTYGCPGLSGVRINGNRGYVCEALNNSTGVVDDLWALWDPGSTLYPAGSTLYKGPSAGALPELQYVQDTIAAWEFVGGIDVHTSTRSGDPEPAINCGIDKLFNSYMDSTRQGFAAARKAEIQATINTPYPNVDYLDWGVSHTASGTGRIAHYGRAPDGRPTHPQLIDPRCDAELGGTKQLEAELILTQMLILCVGFMDDATRRRIIPTA